jgi:hypothetical protein
VYSLFIAAIAAGPVACIAPRQPEHAIRSADTSAIVVQAPSPQDPAFVVILAADAGRYFARREKEPLPQQCSEQPTGLADTWQPTRDIVIRAEALLPPVLAAAWSGVGWGREGRQAWHYHRQYAGIVLGDRELVYINGVETSMAQRAVAGEVIRDDGDTVAARRAVREHLTGAVTAVDAGARSWGVVYDPRTERFGVVAFACTMYGPVAPSPGARIVPPAA